MYKTLGKALANSLRIKIIKELKNKDLTFNEFKDILNIDDELLNHQLDVLTKSKAIINTNDIYKLNIDFLKEFYDYLSSTL